MSKRLKLLIVLLALSSLPALSACADTRRGTDAVGEEGPSGEGISGAARSGTIEEEEEGTSGEVREGAEGTTQ
jgi:hypothetical protein